MEVKLRFPATAGIEKAWFAAECSSYQIHLNPFCCLQLISQQLIKKIQLHFMWADMAYPEVFLLLAGTIKLYLCIHTKLSLFQMQIRNTQSHWCIMLLPEHLGCLKLLLQSNL